MTEAMTPEEMYFADEAVHRDRMVTCRGMTVDNGDFVLQEGVLVVRSGQNGYHEIVRRDEGGEKERAKLACMAANITARLEGDHDARFEDWIQYAEGRRLSRQVDRLTLEEY